MRRFDKYHRPIFIALVCLFYVGLFFSIRFSNIWLISMISLCILSARSGEIMAVLRRNRVAQSLLLLFGIQIIGLLYTSNMKTGAFLLEKKIEFLLFPVFLLPVLNRYAESKAAILRIVGVITLASGVVLLLRAIARTVFFNSQIAFSYISGNESGGFTYIHYVYYSMYFTVGSLIFFESYFDRIIVKRNGILWLAALFAYCLFIITLVASKSGIIVFTISSVVFIFFKTRNQRAFLIFVLMLVIALTSFLLLTPSTLHRFVGLEKDASVVTQDVLPAEMEFTGVNVRLLFWKIPLAHMGAEEFFFGVGTGDAQDFINSLYVRPEYQMFGYVDWDSHNEWVYQLIELGGMGVLCFALFYLAATSTAFRQGDKRFGWFLFVTFIFSMTECILEVNKGVLFFSFLATLFSVNDSSSQQSRISQGTLS